MSFFCAVDLRMCTFHMEPICVFSDMLSVPSDLLVSVTVTVWVKAGLDSRLGDPLAVPIVPESLCSHCSQRICSLMT